MDHYDGDKEHAKDRKEHPRCIQVARKEHPGSMRKSAQEPASMRVIGGMTAAGRKTPISSLQRLPSSYLQVLSIAAVG